MTNIRIDNYLLQFKGQFGLILLSVLVGFVISLFMAYVIVSIKHKGMSFQDKVDFIISFVAKESSDIMAFTILILPTSVILAALIVFFSAYLLGISWNDTACIILWSIICIGFYIRLLYDDLKT